MPKKTSADNDFQGLVRLLKDASIATVDLVEAMQEEIVHPPFLPSTPIQRLITAISGMSYKSVKAAARIIAGGIEKLNPLFSRLQSRREWEQLKSVLNGVLGDYLEAQKNPLALPMQLLYGEELEEELDNKEAKPKLLLLIHGLCMRAAQWTRAGQNHGIALAEALDAELLFLNYNSGLHISTNGRRLSQKLETLVASWPVEIEELSVLAHSMGGLVLRSALHYGIEEGKQWPKKLKKVVFLGSPHQGAALEGLGKYIDKLLESLPYARPFARLGKMRSAGIQDLRYGSLLDSDWLCASPLKPAQEPVQRIPLPEGIDFLALAALLGPSISNPSSMLLGDGLVSQNSALALHKNPEKSLAFRKRASFLGCSHFELLSKSEVYEQIASFFEL